MTPARVWAGACATLFLLMPAPAAHSLGAPDFPPGRYEVDARTTVHFHVNSLFGAYQGDFVQPSGQVTIDSAHPGRASIDISFPVAHMTTGDASTDQMLKGPSFFDMDHYPLVRFTADNAVVGGDELKVAGQLTMHGQTRPFTILARFAGSQVDASDPRPSLHFTGEASVLRSEFGMGFGRPFVSNRVDLTVDATFRPA